VIVVLFYRLGEVAMSADVRALLLSAHKPKVLVA